MPYMPWTWVEFNLNSIDIVAELERANDTTELHVFAALFCPAVVIF